LRAKNCVYFLNAIKHGNNKGGGRGAQQWAPGGPKNSAREPEKGPWEEAEKKNGEGTAGTTEIALLIGDKVWGGVLKKDSVCEDRLATLEAARSAGYDKGRVSGEEWQWTTKRLFEGAESSYAAKQRREPGADGGSSHVS